MPRLATRIEQHRDKLVLVPAFRQGADTLADIRNKGQVLQATVIKYTRSAHRENWYWRFVQYVAEGLGISRYALHADIRLKAELVQCYILGENGPLPVLKSTKREEMEDADHREFVELAIEIVFRHHLPGIRRSDVIKEVDRMVGGPRNR